MLFFKGYLNKNEAKAIEAVDKLRDLLRIWWQVL